MMRTMAGEQAFRTACDLYFARHDGEAATCEDFITAMEDGTGLDLNQFRLWYRQAGTPRVEVNLAHEGDTAVLSLRQTVPPTPGQPAKLPMPIPLRIALLDRATGTHDGERLVMLDTAEKTLRFEGFEQRPILSVNRGFTAPVAIERATTRDDLVFLARHDDDAFARYEAMQELVVGELLAAVEGEGDREEGRAAVGEALRAVLTDEAIDDSMRGELMVLPSQTYLAEQILVARPDAIHREREALKSWLGSHLKDELHRLYERAEHVPSDAPGARGARKVKTQVLILAAASDPDKAIELAARQYEWSDNMTDRQGALMVLAGLDGIERTNALLDFYNRYKDNPLVIDKWFAIQASSLHPQAIAHVKALAGHEDFTLRNPNRVRSLYMAFAGNPHAFHAESGEGYAIIADLILALDPINPQTAARFVTPLGRWRRMEPGRAALMRGELERIAAADSLSRDTYEQVSRSLG
jgi:aminopeptidase N